MSTAFLLHEELPLTLDVHSSSESSILKKTTKSAYAKNSVTLTHLSVFSTAEGPVSDIATDTLLFHTFIDDDINTELYNLVEIFNIDTLYTKNMKKNKKLESMGINLKEIEEKKILFDIKENMCINKEEERSSFVVEELSEKEQECINSLVVCLNLNNHRFTTSLSSIENDTNSSNTNKIDEHTIGHKKDNDCIHLRKYINPVSYLLSPSVIYNLDVYAILCLYPISCTMGYRALCSMILQPLKNKEEICYRVENVKLLKNVGMRMNIPDTQKLSEYIDKRQLNLKDLEKLCTSIKKNKELIKNINLCIEIYIEKNKEQNYLKRFQDEIFQPLNHLTTTLSSLVSLFSEYIDEELNFIPRGSRMKELVEQRNKLKEKIIKKAKAIENNVKIEEKDGVFLFRINRTEYSKVKEKVLVKSVLKSGIIFSTLELEEINREIEEKHLEIKKEENEIKEEFIQEVTKYKELIQALGIVIGLIDAYRSMGYMEDLGFSHIEHKENDTLTMTDAFHPLIEKNCIKNDISLNTNLCIISGPNMGGKTTFLRTLGVVALLGQTGSPVPANYSLKIFNGIQIRMGSIDDPSKGTSTFMEEMKDVAKMCRTNPENIGSLLLIDEFGRGTSSLDGYALSQSLCEYFYNTNNTVLFVTHFNRLGPELKKQNLNIEELELESKVYKNDNTNNTNKDNTIDKNNSRVVHTFKVKKGRVNGSKAIEILKMINMPEEIINECKIEE